MRQVDNHPNKLLPIDSPGLVVRSFGDSVAISSVGNGSTVIIGAPNSIFNNHFDQGAAFIFAGVPGLSMFQQAELIDSGGTQDARFGDSVAISGDTAIIGDYKDQYLNIGLGEVYIFHRSGTTWTEQQRFTSPAGKNTDLFDFSVAISGDTVIVGAPGTEVGNISAGAAYIFARTGTVWNLKKKLQPEYELPSAQFGGSVDIWGYTAVIGAKATNNSQGSVYIFEFDGNTWVQQAILTASDGDQDDYFGSSVSINYNTVVIGAPGKDSYKGAVYIFQRIGTTWTQVTKITDADGESIDSFGASVRIRELKVLIGSPSDNVGGNGSQGSVSLYYGDFMSNWSLVSKFTAADGEVFDGFGTSLDFAADGQILVGSPGNDVNDHFEQGSVYVFYPNLQLHKKLSTPNGQANDGFGVSLETSYEGVIIGAPGAYSYRGAAHYFSYDQSQSDWNYEAELTAFDGFPVDNFGLSVTIDGGDDTVIVRAPLADIGGNTDQGAAYVFRHDGTTWTSQQKLIDLNGAANDLFGWSVATNGGYLLIGALNADIAPSFAGKGKQTTNLFGTDQGAVTFYKPVFLVPTAAGVSISGRVQVQTGKAIRKVSVTLTAPDGSTRTIFTNALGYYRFDDISAGETYVISVRHDGFTFNPDSRVINAAENIENIDFTASP
ncbi:hypothetical protein BH10ACI1_BH10ACI1_13220 [soil metagenome]